MAVYRLTVKGNIRHRLTLLGVDVPDHELTNAQRELRECAAELSLTATNLRRQALRETHLPGPAIDLIVDFLHDMPERPYWANGAVVYITSYQLASIQESLRAAGITLQSKHMLVSEEMLLPVQAAFDARPTGPGREVFLKMRAGVIAEIIIARPWDPDEDDRVLADTRMLQADLQRTRLHRWQASMGRRSFTDNHSVVLSASAPH